MALPTELWVHAVKQETIAAIHSIVKYKCVRSLKYFYWAQYGKYLVKKGASLRGQWVGDGFRLRREAIQRFSVMGMMIDHT